MHLGDRLVLIGAHQDYGGSQRLGAERLPTPFDLHVRFRVGAVEAHRLEPLLFSVDKDAVRVRRKVRMVSIFGGGDRRGRAAACRDRDELPGGFGGDRGRGRAEGPRGAPQGNNSISVRPVARLAIEGHPTRDACRRSPLYGQRVQVPQEAENEPIAIGMEVYGEPRPLRRGHLEDSVRFEGQRAGPASNRRVGSDGLSAGPGRRPQPPQDKEADCSGDRVWQKASGRACGHVVVECEGRGSGEDTDGRDVESGGGVRRKTFSVLPPRRCRSRFELPRGPHGGLQAQCLRWARRQ